MKAWMCLISILCYLWCGCQNSQIKQTPSEDGKGTTSATGDAGSDVPEQPTRREDTTSVAEKVAVEDSSSSGIWGGWQVIDVHAHIGQFQGFDLSTPTLMSNIQKYGVTMALISNIDGANLPGTTRNLDEQKTNQATVDTVRAYPKQLRGIAWTRPKDGSPQRVEPFLKMTLSTGSKDRIFVAMKFHPEMNQFAADDAKIDGYMKLCEKYKLAAVFHNGGPGSNSSPERIYKAAQRFPKVPVVLYHMGFGGQHQASIQVVKQALQKKDALLYLGTAQADPKAVVQAVREVGSQYVMFGTDATYYGADHYDRYKPMVELLQKELSATDFANVMRENAKRVFGL